MLLAEPAVLVHFNSVRIVLLVLLGVVVALFAFCACQCNLSAHDFHLRLNSLLFVPLKKGIKKRPISKPVYYITVEP